METLNPRIRALWLIEVVIVGVILGIAAGAILFFLNYGAWIGAVVFVLIVLVGGIYQVYRYRVWKFEIQDDAVYLERGVLVFVKTVVPFVRIQHVDSRRSALERLTGLASVVIYTAGSRGADVTIPGLTPQRAEELREQLRQLAIEDEAKWEDAV